MTLDLALLTMETRPQPEANVLGQPGLHKSGRQESPGSTNTGVRDPMKSKEQMLTENQREIRRTHHREQRTDGKGQRQWRG